MISSEALDIARRSVFELTHHPMILSEEKTGIIRAGNQAFFSLFNLTEGQVIGHNTISIGLWADEGRRNSFLSCLAIEGRLDRYPIEPAAGRQLPLLYASVEPIREGDDRLLLIDLVSSRDQCFEKNVDVIDPAEEKALGLRFLSQTVIRFLSDDGGDLYDCITSELRRLVPYSIVVVSSVETENNYIRTRSISAPKELKASITEHIPPFLDRITGFLTPDARSSLLRGTLDKDPSFPSTGSTPVTRPADYNSLLDDLAVREIWNVGLGWQDTLLGIVSILLREPDKLPNNAVVETFVHQAAVAIQRNQRSRALESSLREKEILLAEIHHRVKNNLQIIASLLNLQTGRTKNVAASRVLSEAATRIQSMALVHTMLYGSDSFSSINMAEYLRTLTTQIFRGARIQASTVELRFELEKLFLDADLVIPLGLIVTELVTNALKYGVGIPGPGSLSIRLSKQEHRAEIVVADSGHLLPADFDPASLRTLGMQLIANLTTQIGGSFSFSVGSETSFRVHFPV